MTRSKAGNQRLWARLLLVVVFAAGGVRASNAQFVNNWLSGGSLHARFSEVGGEREGDRGEMRWPGLYGEWMRTNNWRGTWIAATDVTDEFGTRYPYRVVHAGPRVTGAGEFFPVEFKLVSKYPPTEVFVDGLLSESLAPMSVDEVDPSIPSDFMILNEVNTLLGISMKRRILQFSQEFHDNYVIIEYTFTNTGNTDDDAEIELPNQTLEGVYFFIQWRTAIGQLARYVIGNGTGWGINNMVDTWGDGEQDNLPPPAIPVRAQVSWHGFYPAKDVDYDNLGAPILPEALPAERVADTDTLGRLAGAAFAGQLTIYADKSPTEPVDDFNQPTTTTWIGSDDAYQSQNDAFNPAKMEQEYKVVSTGHKLPAHAYVTESTGMEGWLNGTSDPSHGTPGGFSSGNGYGPYTLGPGDSIRVVMAEGVSGLSWEAAAAIGQAYKRSGANEEAPISYPVGNQVHALTKNEWVMTGRDSLYQMFLRATDNHASNYAIPSPPQPPTVFNVNSGGDRITLSWEYPDDAPPPDRFEIYRAANGYDSTYVLIHEAAPGDNTFDDSTPIRGINYFYYITAVKEGNTDATGRTPTGVPLRSSRYATQTYVEANLKRQPGTALSDVRIVPNPFDLSSSPSVRWPDQTDKLGFLNIPGQARIEIYTELGELVDAIDHSDGSGDTFWNHTTSSGQVVASGIYFAVITNTETGDRIIKKFVIIR